MFTIVRVRIRPVHRPGASARPGVRSLLRTLGWNALGAGGALLLVAFAGEAYLRHTRPFMTEHRPQRFVPGVGRLLEPDAEVRFTNRLDYWTASRTNSLGFLAREPPSPRRAAESHHLAFVGDSLVEAREVPIPDKFPAQLERMARNALPGLDLTVSAFGRGNTGQVHQLPFYDCCIRRLRPRLLVLLFHPNDLWDNHPVLRGMLSPRRVGAEFRLAETSNGTLEIRSPATARVAVEREREREREEIGPWGTPRSWLAAWVRAKHRYLTLGARNFGQPDDVREVIESWFGHRPLPPDADARTRRPTFAETLEYTEFALRAFRDRAVRDDVRPVLLLHESARRRRALEPLTAIADRLGIPVLDQAATLLREGVAIETVHFAHDGHWNAAGHRLVARTVLDYLEAHSQN